MRVSTRVRYGVRLMVSLALHYGNGPILLKNIATDEGISEKYLSLIIIPVRGKGLVRSTRGARGGYELARPPEQISLKEIVDTLDGESCLVDCVKDSKLCARAPLCASRDLWAILGGKISETLSSMTLAALADIRKEKVAKAALNYAV
jgi:Rrf2 family protein